MVGTAYVGAEPERDRFVEVGSQPGGDGRRLLYRRGHEDHEPDPPARSGTVIQVLIEDGQPVEFGETVDDHRVICSALIPRPSGEVGRPKCSTRS